jgi:hypothetical protein
VAGGAAALGLVVLPVLLCWCELRALTRPPEGTYKVWWTVFLSFFSFCSSFVFQVLLPKEYYLFIDI